MSITSFEQHLNKPNIWKSTLYPQVEKIVQSLFYRIADQFDSNKNCFELFGLDFVIDEDLKPWLIEANMSPACALREGHEWL